MKTSKWHTDFENLLDTLVGVGIAIARNSIVLSKSDSSEFFSWTFNPSFHGGNERHSTVREYLDQLHTREFSCLLSDGALVQISFRTKRDMIIWHRYNYFPCPIDVNLTGFIHQDIDLAQYVAELAFSDMNRIQLRTAIRFDYSPDDARVGHPHSHLHLNAEDCRVAVCEPLTAREFVEFIIRSFYDAYKGPFANAHAAGSGAPQRCISIDEENYYHVNRRRIS
jgi:hypothetical protein